MMEYVIYTIMVGKYGNIYQPLYIDDRFDYVLFSNDFEDDYIGVWKILPIPIPNDIKYSDNKRLSRYPKTHPETLLSQYKASLYIDANVQITDSWVYDRIIELDKEEVDYAGIKLLATGRDCIYRHAYDMCLMRAENDSNAMIELHALRKEKFPEHFGLNENNIIYRKHSEKMRKVDELWWKWIVSYSFRDQFSYMYCLWKYNIPIMYFLSPGEDSRNSTHFNFYHHNKDKDVAKKKWVNHGFLEKSRNALRKLTNIHKTYYEFEWLFISKLPFSRFCLFLSAIVGSILNLPLFIVKFLCKYIKKEK